MDAVKNDVKRLVKNERLNETNQAPNQELSKPVVKLPP